MPYADQIQRILEASHHDPFQVLGYHEFENKKSSIRAFFPHAQKVEVLFGKAKKSQELIRIRDEGFYHIDFKVCKKKSYRFRITDYEGNSWFQEDPYRFKPFISDFDIHLFREGNHHRLYEVFGSHHCEHEGVWGVRYSVWAPNATSVGLVGMFNNWDGRCHLMRNRGDSGIWEIFVPSHDFGELYKYEIKTRDNQTLVKSDPYGLEFEMRPKTSTVVTLENTYHWADEDWMRTRHKHNSHDSAISIYEVHLSSWKRCVEEDNRWLTYREFADQLIPYVKWLGYTHIELMPIAEHPFDGSWGYQVTGYFAPTSRFGCPDDFKYFIDRCHQEGIGVIVDWVPAHFPKDAHSLAQFDGTALYEHEDPRLGEHQDWGTLIFNFGRNEVKNFLISNALFWMEHFHVDGLRVDAVASMLYLDYSRKEGEWIPNQWGGRENIEAIEFIKYFNSVIYKYFPGTLTAAEESTAFPNVSAPIYNGGLGFGFKWNMGWMHDFLEYITKDPIHRKFHHDQLTFSMLYSFHENFILPLSHDEVVHGKKSLISKMPGDDWQKSANLRSLYGFMYAHPGKKLLFMGGEFGQWDEWDFDSSLDWHLNEHPLHKGLQLWVKDLNEIYRQEKALFEVDYDSAGFEWIDCSDYENSIVSMIRWAKGYTDPVIAIFNFTPICRQNYRLGIPFPGHYKEVLNSDSERYGGSNAGNMGGVNSEETPWMSRPHSIEITLPPLSTIFLKKS